MSLSQGKVLRNGKIIESPLEMNAPEESNMAQSNSNDSDTNDSSDISSQLSEMKENYERKINELHLEFSQLKDLMMAVIDKTINDSQPSSSQGPSKQPQPGRDSMGMMLAAWCGVGRRKCASVVLASIVNVWLLGLVTWIAVFPSSRSTNAGETSKHVFRMKAGDPSAVSLVSEMSASLWTCIFT